MAATTLPDADHVVTRNPVHYSKSYSVLPICVDSIKRGKNNSNRKTAKKTAKKRGRNPRKARTFVGEMENNAMAGNAELLLDLQDIEDLQNILAQHASGNTLSSSSTKT